MSNSIVITGGANGIGAAVVSRLLTKKCHLTVLDVVEPEASTVDYVQCDLADPVSIDNAITSLPEQIDALVNVAGVSNAFPAETIMAVNLLGLRHLTESLIPRIVDAGNIVIVASSAGHDWRSRREDVELFLTTSGFESGLTWLRAHENTWIENPYKFSKQCAAAYTYKAAGLAHKRGVRANCVNPGSTGTQLTADFRELVGEELYDWGVKQIGREGNPDDIAEVIEFLAIGNTRWLNGVEMIVDGGYIGGLTGGWIDRSQSPGAKQKK